MPCFSLDVEMMKNHNMGKVEHPIGQNMGIVEPDEGTGV